MIVFLSPSHEAQGFNDPNAHPITLISNGQGLHYLTSNNNVYYVDVDSNKNIHVEHESEFDIVS